MGAMRSLGLSALVVLAGCGERARDPRPNLVLVSLDSVRADALGVHGARLASGESPTPVLDALASAGVVYDEARATTSWTLPSHASLFTGLPELAHAVEQDGEKLADGLELLTETLADAGYRTHGIYSGPYLDPRFGFGRGFERYEHGYGAALAQAADELETVTRLLASFDPAREPERAQVARERLALAERGLEVASHADVSAARVTALALAALEDAHADERPFFLFAHYFDAHYDYRPPPEFLRRVAPGGSIDEEVRCSPVTTDPSSVASCRLRYQGEVAWLDAEVGRLLARLAELGLAENTLVAVVSDHGDEFLEHGALGHRRTLQDEVLRVPVLLRFPGKLAAGERRTEALALHELHGVLLEQLGVAGPRAPEAAPIARLVRPEFIELEFPSGRVRTNRLYVLERFWHEDVVVERTGVLLRALDPLAPALRAEFERRAAEELAASARSLRWGASRGAEPSWSDDFEREPARSALTAYRASYRTWVALRSRPAATEDAEGLAAALRGLGYGGAEGTFSVASDELVLPEPGPAGR